MPLGTSMFLIAVGAILRYAVTATVSGIDLTTVGLILMIVGIVGLVLSLLWMLIWSPRRGGLVRDRVIDVRQGYERDAGHIAGTRHIELTELSSQAATVERERPVVFYCRVGSRSLMAAQAFRASGFDAYSLDGGLAR